MEKNIGLRPEILVLVDIENEDFFTYEIPKDEFQFRLIQEEFERKRVKVEFFFESDEVPECRLKKIESFQEFKMASEVYDPQGVIMFIRLVEIKNQDNGKEWRCRSCGKSKILSSEKNCPVCLSKKPVENLTKTPY
jgi:rubrerythrin